ncbi:MAG: glycerol-3-phosphate 1-O-acyltransferase PlsY [Clostridia bacterium]|nr:glycerol-3-phosphate 1-O-acyltransferase PlsY [Clostridia bacterium]
MKVLEFLARLIFCNRGQEGLIFTLFGATVEKDGIVLDNPYKLIPMFLIVLAWMIVSYLLGSINFSILISKLAFHDDIRKYGSQNAGSTNMNRVYGSKIGALTLVGDVGKAVIAVLIARVLLGDNAAALCGFCCMLGHCFPIYYRFKGGKGVATAGGVILALEPLSGTLTLVIFAIVTLGMHYVSLGSIMAGLFYPVLLNSISKILTQSAPTALMTISAIAMATLLVTRHHTNIKRLLKGTENKFYLKKKKKDEESSEAPVAPRSLHRIDDEDEQEDKE